MQGPNGNFYGTTSGGIDNTGGTVFTMTPDGTVTTLYNFCEPNVQPLCANPDTGLVEGADGNFYGTTLYGTTSEGSLYGGGTVFRVTPAGELSTIYEFCQQGSFCVDGQFPETPLVPGSDGNLYGITYAGGNECSDDSDGCGTVFKVTPGGMLTTLHTFCSQPSCVDGGLPSGLILGTNGVLYGTTYYGGTSSACPNGCGLLFSLPTGMSPFVNALPAAAPVGANIQIIGLNLTGTTKVTFNGVATPFSVSASGNSLSTTVPAGAKTGNVQVFTPAGTLSTNVPFSVL